MTSLIDTPSASLTEMTDHEMGCLRLSGDRTHAALLHTALWECASSHQFRIELDWNTAIPLLARMSPYNAFSPSKVIGALRHIDSIIPRADYGPGNPNNGSRTFTLAPGCEGSDVLYLIRREFHPREPLTRRQIVDIENAMHWADADEVSHVIHEHRLLGPGNRDIEFRFWWD